MLVISDSTHAGTRKDGSGLAIREFLEKQGVMVTVYDILPDEEQMIADRLRKLADQEAGGSRIHFRRHRPWPQGRDSRSNHCGAR